MVSNSSASSSPFSSAAEGITGGYTGGSLTIKVMIAFFLGLAMYNAVELQVLIFGTFKRFRGLYFWSLLISSMGIFPYCIGFLFKYFSILTNAKWFSLLLLSVGWYPLITGQAIVLYSRLHLLLTGERRDKILKWTKWMIIVDAIVLHIPTTVLTIGSNSDTHTKAFVDGYNVMEKVQMCGFFLQEVVLSSIYIIEAIRILRSSVQMHTKRLMYQLLAINVLIITLDLGLLGLECASLYILETITKPAFYSIKLKLEFAILGKLVDFVGGRNPPPPFARDEKRSSSALNGGTDISEFVDLTKVGTDVTRTSQPSQPKRTSTWSRPGIRGQDFDLEIARLEHVETLPSEARIPNGDSASPRY
ncbi:uncharacterized protein A1O5_12220 [Cladophialophora psammophila CBS 110553]|uniref:DUF7703 domain-containing protein n=1 Tax=Cladophialophora psammophila CBS 110553 TaxID=1182543 RepID=W9WLP5_9EURO|nr:uncharacterized protein A1O5_12220 [Cladophialophora psammophila CBS 110553]EXJ59339.1 hypothetical protein A1O5_12220 [Cladophialophora psammophila CBS 110553]